MRYARVGHLPEHTPSQHNSKLPGCTCLQVPVLLALVYVALWLHTKLTWFLPSEAEASAQAQAKQAE